MTHPLDGAFAKLERATELLNTLQVAALRYLDPIPWDLLGEVLHEPDRYVVTVGVKKAPPPRLGAIFGDLIHNLRSSLDYLVYELVRLNHQEPQNKTGFPIYKDRPTGTFSNASRDALRGVADEPIALIEKLQPYNRSDLQRTALIIVREFSNRDKHRNIVPFIAAMRHPGDDPDISFTTNEHARLKGDFSVKTGGVWDEGKELVVAPIEVTGPEPYVEMHGNLNVEVAFGDESLLRIDAVPATIGEIIRTIRKFDHFFGEPRQERSASVPAAISLSPSQAQQLQEFVADGKAEGRLELRHASKLGNDYIEAVVLDANGRETTEKRTLAP
jgi:hypothetical protein